MKERLDAEGLENQYAALCQVSKQAFYNTSRFRLRDLTARGRASSCAPTSKTTSPVFSENVQEVLEKFRFHNQIPTLIEADALGYLIHKFLDPSVNLSPYPVLDAAGNVRLPRLDNHGMGTVFEELIRRFSEENNEEGRRTFHPARRRRADGPPGLRPVADQVQSAPISSTTAPAAPAAC